MGLYFVFENSPPVPLALLCYQITVFKVIEEGDCIFLLSFHGIISCHLTEENVKTVHFSPIYLETFRSNIRYHQPPAPPPSLDLKYGFAFIC